MKEEELMASFYGDEEVESAPLYESLPKRSAKVSLARAFRGERGPGFIYTQGCAYFILYIDLKSFNKHSLIIRVWAAVSLSPYRTDPTLEKPEVPASGTPIVNYVYSLVPTLVLPYIRLQIQYT